MTLSPELANLQQVAELLKGHKTQCVAVCGDVTATVSPQLELLSIELATPGISPEERAALQRDIVTAVNRAVREIVVSTARTLDGLQDSPEVKAMREALART